MVRCEEFYQKWRRDPNWCEKCSTSVWYINRYIDLTREYPWLKELSERALRPLFTKKLAGYRYKVAEEIKKLLEERERDPKTGKLKKPITSKEVFTMVKKVLGEEVKGPKPPKPEVKVTEIPETWEFRESRMHPPVSRMDEAVMIELGRLGIPFEFQKEFCVQSTIPDIYLPQRRTAIYLDYEGIHVKREERDEMLRGLLSKRYGIRVVSIPYKKFSQSELRRVVEEIKKEVKES